jgi:uncharacterized protein YbaR (Trm112 family)
VLDDFTGAILYCPVCVTPLDATEWGEQKHVCTNCETEFSLVLDRETVAAHAMHGG